MARAIDVDRVKREIRKNKEKIVISCKQKYVPLSLIYEILNKAPTLTPTNEPLTLEQLREMEDPVWCVRKTVEGFEGFWCLCNHGYILTPARQIFDVKEIPHWVFYRRPPEGEEDT